MYCYLCLLLELLCDVNVYVFEQSAVSVAQFRGPSLRGLAPGCIRFGYVLFGYRYG